MRMDANNSQGKQLLKIKSGKATAGSSTTTWCMDFQTYQRAVINGKEDDFLYVSNSNSRHIISLCNLKTGDTLLHLACRYGKLEILRILVDRHKADVEVGNYEGKRLLHEAAQYSQLDCVKFLIHECHVHVDPLKRADWTPLMLAATKSSLDVVKTLLETGANPLLRNKDGWNVFHIACREGHLPILKLLITHSSNAWDTRSHNLRTPLHTAALHGKSKVISWLLQHSSYDIDVVDSCGVTPLMDALRAGFTDTASILVKDYKANPSFHDKIGRQAIHQVCQAGQLAALDFLVNSTHACVGVASDLTGETPLHTASKEGQQEMIEKLIQYGADINQTDFKGRTALHIASGGQHTACIQVLLLHGALILPDDSGSLPADLARKVEIKELFKMVT